MDYIHTEMNKMNECKNCGEEIIYLESPVDRWVQKEKGCTNPEPK